VLERWLREDVIAGHEEYKADPSKEYPRNQVRVQSQHVLLARNTATENAQCSRHPMPEQRPYGI
jgi:hypothetical protein